MERIGYVYLLLNTSTLQAYVGSCSRCDPIQRMKRHRADKRSAAHPLFQSEGSVSCVVLETMPLILFDDSIELRRRENAALDRMKTTPYTMLNKNKPYCEWTKEYRRDYFQKWCEQRRRGLGGTAP